MRTLCHLYRAQSRLVTHSCTPPSSRLSQLSFLVSSLTNPHHSSSTIHHPSSVIHHPPSTQSRRYAGHSHAKNVKHKKAKTDQQRAIINTKLSQEIYAACRAKDEIRVAAAVSRAKNLNIAKDIIDRAIAKGKGEDGDDTRHYEQVLYEMSSVGGCGLLIECLTDNRHRTAPLMRSIATRNYAVLASPGAISWKFKRCGVVEMIRNSQAAIGVPSTVRETLPLSLLDLAMSLGAEDVSYSEGFSHLSIYTQPTALFPMYQSLHSMISSPSFTPTIPSSHSTSPSAPPPLYHLTLSFTYIADSHIELTADDSVKVAALLEELENCADVQDVYCDAVMDGGVD